MAMLYHARSRKAASQGEQKVRLTILTIDRCHQCLSRFQSISVAHTEPFGHAGILKSCHFVN